MHSLPLPKRFVLVAAGIGLAGSALAIVPDITVQAIAMSYDAANDELSAVGNVTKYVDSSNAEFTTSTGLGVGGTFNLTATIDDAGVFAAGTNNFTVAATVAPLGYNSGTLLTGSLTDFAFQASTSSIFLFEFNSTGGDALAEYAGGPGFIIEVNISGFPNNWTADWSNTGGAEANIVPEPSTYALIAGFLAVAALALRRRVRS